MYSAFFPTEFVLVVWKGLIGTICKHYSYFIERFHGLIYLIVSVSFEFSQLKDDPLSATCPSHTDIQPLRLQGVLQSAAPGFPSG